MSVSEVALTDSFAASAPERCAAVRVVEQHLDSGAEAHQDAHNVRRRLRPAAEAAGVPWATPHVFRHSLATELRDRGYGADVIAKVLGHTDEAFTRRVYIHKKDVPRFDDLDAPAVGTMGA